MSFFRKKYGVIATAASAALLLAACGGGSDKKDSGSEKTETGFVETVENEGEPIDGEKTLRVALVGDSAFSGIFNTEFSENADDSTLYSFSNGEVLTQDESYQWNTEFVDGVLGKLDYDEDRNVATITIKEGAMWQGNDEVEPEEVTVDDIIFTYEVVAHTDYPGVRFNDDFRPVKGVEEYNAGEADTISGLTALDDYTLEIEFIEPVGFQVYQAGGLIWAYASPRHYLGDLEITEIVDSPQVREKPIGFGPFQVNKMVPC